MNNKLPLERIFGVPKKDGRYIDNSMGAFATEFQKAVSDSPVEFLQNVLNMKEEINAPYPSSWIGRIIRDF